MTDSEFTDLQTNLRSVLSDGAWVSVYKLIDAMVDAFGYEPYDVIRALRDLGGDLKTTERVVHLTRYRLPKEQV